MQLNSHEFCYFADIATKNTSVAGFGMEKEINDNQEGKNCLGNPKKTIPI